MQRKSGQSVVVVLIVIALCALLLRAGIQYFIKTTISQNESNASATLKLISTALENYAKNNVGVFPASLSVLLNTTPPYLDKDYISQSPYKGYAYSFVQLGPYIYSCRAEPLKCNITGKKVFVITTGGGIISEDCNKKE